MPFTKRNHVLMHNVDFDNAMFFLSPVTVWKDGVFTNCVGLIDGYNREAVMVSGELFSRYRYQFRVLHDDSSSLGSPL